MEVSGRGFSRYLPFSVALKNILTAVEPLPPKRVLFKSALGMVLAEDVIATSDIPPCDKSAVDGYAVRASDTFGADQAHPKVLRLVFKPKNIKKGEAAEVATGDPLPAGADAVVMLEHTEVKGNLLYVLKPVAPGRNVSQRGEDVQRGKIIIKSGTRLRPQEIGMLAQLKKLRVRVYPRPTVAMIVTGDELVSPWSTENKSIDTNSYMLGSALREVGGVLGFVKRVVDDERKIIRAIHKALNYDVVVITGGTSVGRRDFVPNCLRRLGKLIFHGVAVRPASPTAFGLIKGTPVFCLPGFPVAAFLAFHLFVKPALLKLQGLSPLHSKETVRAVLTTDVTSTLGRTDILRVKLRRAGGRFLAEPLRITGSGVLSSLVNADGIVLIPENIEGLAKGESVEVELI